MVRSRFDAQLEQLNVELIKMGALCEEAITASVSALMKYDRTVVQMVFEKDNEIDHMERDIETFCMRLLFAAAAGSKGFADDFLRLENDFRYGAYR